MVYVSRMQSKSLIRLIKVISHGSNALQLNHTWEKIVQILPNFTTIETPSIIQFTLGLSPNNKQNTHQVVHPLMWNLQTENNM